MDYLLARARASLFDAGWVPFRSTERIYWIYLVTAFLLAFGVFLDQSSQGKRGLRPFLAWLFPGAIYKHKSSIADFAFFVVNRGFYWLLVMPWLVETGMVQRTVESVLNAVAPNARIQVPPGLALDLAFSVVTAIGFDLGLFIGHYLMHKVPLFWEFHKVHHSAEVLTPITVYRQHPVDDIVNISISAVTGGIAQGIFLHLCGASPHFVFVAGLNIVFFAFYVFGYNLRHSHVWLDYGPWLSNLLMSPAQHQIHHSENPQHFDKNMGFTFALWDRIAGTLYVPREREELTFGLGTSEDSEFHSLARLYTRPFATAFRNREKMLVMSKSTQILLLLTIAVTLAFQLSGLLGSHAADRAVRIEDLTWREIGARLDRGTTTAIIPTGGVEQNGPHMVLGKHDTIVAYTCDEIAKRLGNALVAPVIAYVPEGEIEPATEHMQLPGTLSCPEPVFEGVLESAARSLAHHGFRAICFVGEHGMSQAAQARVAAKLSEEWRARGIRVLDVSDYYEDKGNGQLAWLESEGESKAAIGIHAGIRDTSELLAVSPGGVRSDEVHPGKASEGVNGDPTRATSSRGWHLLELKIDAAVRQIQRELGAASKSGIAPVATPTAR